jgi:hypothetical protein
MADKDITSRQLLDALAFHFGELAARFDARFDKLEEMVSGIGDTLADVVDNMATTEDVKSLCTEFAGKTDDLELRIGHRIDAALARATR